MFRTNNLGVGSSQAASLNTQNLGVPGQDRAPEKFIYKNNIKKINPEWKAWNQRQLSSPAVSPEDRPPRIVAEYTQPEALAVVSTPEDLDQIQQVSAKAREKQPVIATDSVESTEELLNEEAANFGVHGLEGDELLAGLYGTFQKWQVPRGYLNKLMKLTEFRNDNKPHEAGLQWLVDDSGSMTLNSDVKNDLGFPMSRFEEAKQRLLTHMEFLQWIPTGPIKIQFLNRSKVIDLRRPAGQSPEEFMEEAKRAITQGFSILPDKNDETPAFEKLQQMLQDGQEKKAIFLEFDGRPKTMAEPPEVLIPKMKQLILNRPDPENHPISFISCTNEDSEVEWAKELEEVAAFCSESDDFKSESIEVAHDQGTLFPFTPGMWMLGQLVGAMWPEDLDALDEGYPMTRHTLENLLGNTLSDVEYSQYYRHFEQKDPRNWNGKMHEFNITERTHPQLADQDKLVASANPTVQFLKQQKRRKMEIEIAQQLNTSGPLRLNMGMPAPRMNPAQSRLLSQMSGNGVNRRPSTPQSPVPMQALPQQHTAAPSAQAYQQQPGPSNNGAHALSQSFDQMGFDPQQPPPVDAYGNVIAAPPYTPTAAYAPAGRTPTSFNNSPQRGSNGFPLSGDQNPFRQR